MWDGEYDIVTVGYQFKNIKKRTTHVWRNVHRNNYVLFHVSGEYTKSKSITVGKNFYWSINNFIVPRNCAKLQLLRDYEFNNERGTSTWS